MRTFLIKLAPFFGVGRLPYGPGTWGTLVSVPLAAGLIWLGPLWHMLATLLLFPLSVLAAQYYCQDCGVHDASEVVIDEVLGFLVAMVMVPLTWQCLLAGFILFRFFDILKPFPISYIDRKVTGGAGVILDDVVAGLIVNIILQLLVFQTNWLGTQIITISV